MLQMIVDPIMCQEVKKIKNKKNPSLGISYFDSDVGQCIHIVLILQLMVVSYCLLLCFDGRKLLTGNYLRCLWCGIGPRSYYDLSLLPYFHQVCTYFNMADNVAKVMLLSEAEI